MSIQKTGVPPTPQNDLPIALILRGQRIPMTAYYFDVRPEELTYTHPTRASVIQTLGGAWVDDFGEGIVDISLSGHTGWRAPDVPLPTASPSLDGMKKAFELRRLFFEEFHQQRRAAAQNGMDPDDAVSLLFADALNRALYRAYPVSLHIRKHKTRPLLYQYQLRLYGLEKLTGDADSISGLNGVLT